MKPPLGTCPRCGCPFLRSVKGRTAQHEPGSRACISRAALREAGAASEQPVTGPVLEWLVDHEMPVTYRRILRAGSAALGTPQRFEVTAFAPLWACALVYLRAEVWLGDPAITLAEQDPELRAALEALYRLHLAGELPGIRGAIVDLMRERLGLVVVDRELDQ